MLNNKHLLPLSVPCSTKPAVKKVLHKCKPDYTTVRFATTGFEGITNTDEEVATLALAEDDGDQGSDSYDDAGGSGGRGGSRRNSKKRNRKDGVTAVTERVSDTDLPAASARPSAAPRQTRARTCRRSKRWGAC